MLSRDDEIELNMLFEEARIAQDEFNSKMERINKRIAEIQVTAGYYL